jgi:hypothetical protein
LSPIDGQALALCAQQREWLFERAEFVRVEAGLEVGEQGLADAVGIFLSR